MQFRGVRNGTDRRIDRSLEVTHVNHHRIIEWIKVEQFRIYAIKCYRQTTINIQKFYDY